MITSTRTLDLKANDFQTRNKWVQYFYDRVLREHDLVEEQVLSEQEGGILSQEREMYKSSGLKVSTKYKMYQEAWNQEVLELEEIWVNEIMTNIEAHWDHVNNRPKMRTDSTVNSKMQSSSIMAPNTARQRKSSIFSCFNLCTTQNA